MNNRNGPEREAEQALAVKIRLKRMGAKKQPFYRIVVADARAARDGRYVDQVGYYNPLREPPEVRVDAERIIGWLSRGAQPSESVRRLLEHSGVWQSWQQRRQAMRGGQQAAGEGAAAAAQATPVTEESTREGTR